MKPIPHYHRADPTGGRCVRYGVLLWILAMEPAHAENIQSVLYPQTTAAEAIAGMSWLLFGGAAAIFAVVMALSAYAVFAKGKSRARLTQRRFIIIGGVALPVVLLSLLLIHSLNVAGDLVSQPHSYGVRVEITGEQFWWRVRYRDQSGVVGAVTANEIHLPIGQPVDFILKSADVIHSFWVPNFAGKVDMIPGRITRLRVTPGQRGTWRGQCAEYCGAQHANMALLIIVQAQEEFDAWLSRQLQAAREPDTPLLRRGKEIFLSGDCGQKDCCRDCHTIRGTLANEDIGPDLTHVGSRRHLAAGLLPNNAGTLGGWIASAQHLKPGNKMPSFGIWKGEDLRALIAYVESLK